MLNIIVILSLVSYALSAGIPAFSIEKRAKPIEKRSQQGNQSVKLYAEYQVPYGKSEQGLIPVGLDNDKHVIIGDSQANFGVRGSFIYVHSHDNSTMDFLCLTPENLLYAGTNCNPIDFHLENDLLISNAGIPYSSANNTISQIRFRSSSTHRGLSDLNFKLTF